MKNIKKCVVICLITAIIASMLCFSANAEVSVWDGTLPTSAAPFVGEGTRESPYIITSAADLANLAFRVNSGESFYQKYVRLVCDIDLAGKPWIPIGGNDIPGSYFDGEFDGNYHSVSNLKIEGTHNQVGLFGMIGGAVIRNIGVDSGSVSGGDYVGGLVGEVFDNAEIKNCYNNADVNALRTDANATAGGIVGGAVDKKALSIIDCVNNGNITVESDETHYARAGGIVGISVGDGVSREIINCYNTGTITLVSAKDNTNTRIGGIAGGFMNEATVERCVSTGNIDVRMSTCEVSRVGILIGSFASHKEGSVNKGAFVDCKYTPVNGFAVVKYPAAEHVSGVTETASVKIPYASLAYSFLEYKTPDDSIPSGDTTADTTAPSAPVTTGGKSEDTSVPTTTEEQHTTAVTPDTTIQEDVSPTPETTVPTPGGDVTTTDAEGKGGCGSSASGAVTAVMLLIMLGTALVRRESK